MGVESRGRFVYLRGMVGESGQSLVEEVEELEGEVCREDGGARIGVKYRVGADGERTWRFAINSVGFSGLEVKGGVEETVKERRRLDLALGEMAISLSGERLVFLTRTRASRGLRSLRGEDEGDNEEARGDVDGLIGDCLGLI